MTLDQLFVGQRCNKSIIYSNVPAIRLTTLHFKTKMPMVAQMAASIFATDTTWTLGGYFSCGSLVMRLLGRRLSFQVTIPLMLDGPFQGQ